MSRNIQIEDDTGPESLRHQLMTMDNLQLVAILEDATAKEMNAQRLAARALTRLRESEETGKQLAAAHEAEMESVIFAIYEECSGGQATSTHMLVDIMTRAFQTLLGESGHRRTALARFFIKIVADTLENMDQSNPGDWSDPIAEQFYLLSALAQTTPLLTTKASNWYTRGQKIYNASEKTS